MKTSQTKLYTKSWMVFSLVLSLAAWTARAETLADYGLEDTDGVELLESEGSVWREDPIATIPTANTAVFRELTAGQQKQLSGGGQLTAVTPLAGFAWPKVQVLQLVRSTGLEAAAVFADFEGPTNNAMVISIKEKPISPRVSHVTYHVDLPWPLTTEVYTVEDTVEKLADGRFRVRWDLLKSENMNDMKGSIFFEEVVPGTTLITYTAWVDPASGMAGLFKGRTITETQTVTDALVRLIETLKGKNPKLLADQIRRFNGRFAFLKQ